MPSGKDTDWAYSIAPKAHMGSTASENDASYRSVHPNTHVKKYLFFKTKNKV